MPNSRIKIRCPKCLNDGTARAELTNRRVSCKVCEHIFRAIPIEDEVSAQGNRTNLSSSSSITPVTPSSEANAKPSRERVEALELEIRRLREDLSAEHPAAGEIAALQRKLAQAIDAAKKAEAREVALRKEIDDLRDQMDHTISTTDDESKTGLREEELRFLRDQVDKARAEAESESRRRRETAATLTARTAEHVQALAAKEAEHGKALNAKQAEYGEVVRGLREQIERAHADTKSQESRRQAAESARKEADARHADEIRVLREELGRTQSNLDEARKALDGLRHDRESATADHSRIIDELNGHVANLESRLKDAEGIRVHRDQLTQELESHKGRLSDTERLAYEHKERAEGLRAERDRIEAARSAELADIRDQLEKTRIQRDRLSDELDSLKASVEEAERLAVDWGYASTELDVPRAVEGSSNGASENDPESATVFDGGTEQLRAEFDRSRAEAERLAAELSETTDRLNQKEVELADLALERNRVEAEAREAGRLEVQKLADQGKAEAENLRRELEKAKAAAETAAREAGQREAAKVNDQGKAEAENLRRELEKAKAAAEAAARANSELAARVRKMEAEPPPTAVPGAAFASAIDPALIEAERKRAVDEAVKGAWADFERRLADTQAKLKAANTRAEMMEFEAREARQASRDGDEEGSSSEDGPSLSTIRIHDARGTARLTAADAEARLALAKQLAVERKDKSLIDRINKMSDKVQADLESRNYTLAETLVRGAEIETGLDPGGFSINGLRIFRASPTIVGSLQALNPAFDRVMRQGDLGAIKSTLEEMKTILGDQAGLPEIRRPGRTPTTKRPIAEAEALRLFIGALEGESWLIRPISLKKPLPDTSLTTYASLIEASCEARKSAENLDTDHVELLDKIIAASCLMLTRRQQADGHFSFLDPRGKASKAASVVEGMVAQRPDAVKDGWVIHVDPIGMAQTETGACGVALAVAGQALGRADWVQASQKAADWAMAQPCLPNFVANAASAGLLARAYLDARQDRHLIGLTRKLTLGVLPGQVENGRWMDPTSATTPSHLLIIGALHNAWEAIPSDREEIRKDLKASINQAMTSLLAECKALGVPPQGSGLRELLRHRNLFPTGHDSKLEPAILDSATVVQELCHDGPKPKLGVASDQLAALIHL